jgi:hypothetical protein
MCHQVSPRAAWNSSAQQSEDRIDFGTPTTFWNSVTVFHRQVRGAACRSRLRRPTSVEIIPGRHPQGVHTKLPIHSGCVHPSLKLGPEHAAGFGDFGLFTGSGDLIRGLPKHCGQKQHQTMHENDEIQAHNSARWDIVNLMTAFSRRR